jgi:sugar/nucleoside kinase (ribokinase family)
MPNAAPKTVYDLISIGDATIDLFVGIDDASVVCDIKKDSCLLCISYADKIPVSSFQRVIGGNAANNAVGSSRLGLKSAISTIVGSDDTGKKVIEMLTKEKVSTAFVQVAKGQETNSSVVLNYKTERTILVYHVDRMYKLPKLRATKWIYLTSMGKNHQGIHDELLSYLQKTKTKLGFNPGTHQLKEGLEKLRPLLAVTDVVFVNKEEARRLVGDIRGMAELLSALRSTGPKIAVITDGEKGSYAFDGQKYWACGITGTHVLQRTGAGDAFATAFVAALQHKKSIPEALRWGTMNSASVISQIGPQAGLLTKSQMASRLRKFPHVIAKPL